MTRFYVKQIALAVAVASVGFSVQGLGQTRDYPSEPSILSPILAGGVLGLVGVAGGAYIGYEVDTSCDNTSDFCLEPGFFLGAALLGTAGASLGAHLGNRGRGSVGTVFVYSLLTWGAGIGGAAALSRVNDPAAYALLYALPAIQLGVTVAAERSLGRRNEARHRERTRVGVVVRPARGGLDLGVHLGF